MTADRPYRHPGHAFIAQHGALQAEADLWRYVEFLRREAGLSDAPPIDLSRLYSHFGIPTPVRAPLDEQQGILVDSSSGLILIKEDDPIARQRFTEGHELMELLFDAQSEARSTCSLPQWDEARKERLCDRGAAELLMPAASFVPRLAQWGLSLKTIRTLAERYQTSLLATALRTMQHSQGDHALVMWHFDWKPSERKVLASRPAKKLRIWWRSQTPNWSGGFIPKDKSIAVDSLIHQSYTTRQPQQGSEAIDFGWGSVGCAIDAMPLQVGEKFCVLALLHGQSDSAKIVDRPKPLQPRN